MDNKKLEKMPLSIAVQALEKTKRELIERHKLDIDELDRAIANIRKLPLKKKVVPAGNGNGKKGNWLGMGLPDAVHAMLSASDGPVPFRELMSGLQQKGVRLGDPSKPQRFQANLKTTVINNRKRFRYDKRKDTVTLLHAVV